MWLVPIISATWNTDIGRTGVQIQTGQKVSEPPILLNKAGVVSCAYYHGLRLAPGQILTKVKKC
jgi:hypothetical protein